MIQIGQAMENLKHIKDPIARNTELEKLTRNFTKVQNAYNWSRHTALTIRQPTAK